MEGLLGLSQSINTRETAMQDLGVLERMDARVQSDRQAEVQNQQAEQLFYEQMYAKADTFLDKDRKAINKRIAMAQGQVKSSLNDHGGSTKSFFEKGGFSVMNNIKNDIIRSEEAVRYESNKTNMAKILEAKEKGFAHLIAPNDLKSAEDYNNNENGGAITYSGLMSEIEMPPSANFDYGTDIPINKILTNGSNMMKIKGNYMIQNPDAPEPTYTELIRFSMDMGYGGTGSNIARMREDTLKAKARADYDKKTSTDNKNSFLSNFNDVKGRMPKSSLNDVLKSKEEGGHGGSLVEDMMEKDPALKQLLKEKSQLMSTKRGLDRKGFDGNDLIPNFGDDMNLWRNKMGLKDSYDFMPMSANKMAEAVFKNAEGLEYENGQLMNFLPDQKMYRMDGVRLSGDRGLNPIEHTGTYKTKGVVTALKAFDGSTGDSVLLVDVYDSDNKLDQKATDTQNKAYMGENGGSETTFTTVIALEDENGNLFYKEIDISEPDIKTAMSNAIGADDNIADAVNQDNEMSKQFADIEQNTTEEKIKFKTAINQMSDNVFQDDIFKGEGNKYFGANSGGQENRYDMMKSFYMAFDYINNSYKRSAEHPQGDPNVYEDSIKSMFTKDLFSLNAAAGEIEDDLRNYDTGNSPKKMVSKWLSNVNRDLPENDMGRKANAEIAYKWTQLLDMM